MKKKMINKINLKYKEYRTEQDREDKTYDKGEKWHGMTMKHIMIEKKVENNEEIWSDDIDVLK